MRRVPSKVTKRKVSGESMSMWEGQRLQCIKMVGRSRKIPQNTLKKAATVAKMMFSLSSTHVLTQWYSGEHLTTHDLILLVRLKPCNPLRSDSDYGPNLTLALRGIYLLPLPVRMGWKEALRSGSPSTFSLYDPILLIQVIHPSCIDRRDDRILINPCATKMLPGPITNRYTTVLWAHKRSRLNLSYRSNNRRLLLSTSDLPVERRWSLCPLSSRSIIRLICIL